MGQQMGQPVRPLVAWGKGVRRWASSSAPRPQRGETGEAGNQGVPGLLHVGGWWREQI